MGPQQALKGQRIRVWSRRIGTGWAILLMTEHHYYLPIRYRPVTRRNRRLSDDVHSWNRSGALHYTNRMHEREPAHYISHKQAHKQLTLMRRILHCEQPFLDLVWDLRWFFGGICSYWKA